MNICSESNANNCDEDFYCDFVAHRCESCHFICNEMKLDLTECQDNCPDFYLKLKGFQHEAIQSDLLLMDTPSIVPQNDINPDSRRIEKSFLFIVLITLIAVTLVVIIIAILVVAKSRSCIKQAHFSQLDQERGETNAYSQDELALTVQSTFLGREADIMHNLGKVSTVDVCNPPIIPEEVNNTVTLLSQDDGNESRSNNATEEKQYVTSQEVQPKVTQKAHSQKERRIPQISEDYCGREVSLKITDTGLNNKPKASGITPSASTRNQRQKPSETRPSVAALDTKAKIKTPIPVTETPECTHQPTGDLRLEIDEFYYSYNKNADNHRNEIVEHFEAVPLLNAKDDKGVNQEDLAKTCEGLNLNGKETNTTDVEAVVSFRKYGDKEDDSGHGTDETALKTGDLTPQTSVTAARQKQPPPPRGSQQGSPHPNIRIYDILNKLRWITGMYSEGNSIYIAVDNNEISNETALEEIVLRTNCNRDKFHINTQETRLPMTMHI